MDQPSLFAAPTRKPLARHPLDPLNREAPLPTNGTPTSNAAAEAMRSKASGLRERVFAWIDAQGQRGATMDECEVALNVSSNSVRPRFYELAGKDPRHEARIVETILTRPTRSGSAAAVYVSLRQVRP